MEINFYGNVNISEENNKRMEFMFNAIDLAEQICVRCIPKEETILHLDEEEKNYDKEHLHDKLYDVGKLNKFYEKRLFISELLDFCLYMRQALINLKKHNPQIAWTLVRKPLIDDLLILEHLFIDSETIINDLIKGSPKEYKDFEEVNDRIQNKYKGEIIDVINIRKKDPLNIKNYCDKSLHAVTTYDKNGIFKSKQGELNFIFMNNALIEKHTEDFILLNTMVVFYALQIIVKLYIRIFDIDAQEQKDIYNSFIEFAKKIKE